MSTSDHSTTSTHSPQLTPIIPANIETILNIYGTEYSLNSTANLTLNEFNLLKSINVNIQKCFCGYCIFCAIPTIRRFVLNPISDANQEIPITHNGSLIKHILEETKFKDYIILIPFKSKSIDPEIFEQAFRINPKDRSKDYYDYVNFNDNHGECGYFIVSDPTEFIDIDNNASNTDNIDNINNISPTTSSNIIMINRAKNVKAPPYEHTLRHNDSDTAKYVDMSTTHNKLHKFIIPSHVEVTQCSRYYDDHPRCTFNTPDCECPVIDFTKHHIKVVELTDYHGPLIDYEKFSEMMGRKQDNTKIVTKWIKYVCDVTGDTGDRQKSLIVPAGMLKCRKFVTFSDGRIIEYSVVKQWERSYEMLDCPREIVYGERFGKMFKIKMEGSGRNEWKYVRECDLGKIIGRYMIIGTFEESYGEEMFEVFK